MSQILNAVIVVMGIDIGKNSFHVVGLDQRGAIVLRQKRSRGQVNARFANMPPCLIGREACVVAHHLSRELKAFVTTWTYEEPRTACVCLRHRLAREHRSFHIWYENVLRAAPKT